MFLFLLPHPDDEFFILPYINLIKKNNQNIKIIYFTNGEFNKHKSITREKESIKVLKKFNVNIEEIYFYGRDNNVFDACIFDNYLKIIHFLKKFISKNIDHISRIIIPAWEGGHHDHDCLNLIVQKVGDHFSISNLIYQFYLYNAYKTVYPFFRVIYPIENYDKSHSINIKLNFYEAFNLIFLAFLYKSQWKTFLGLLPFAAVRLLIKREIILQQCDYKKIYLRPHSGILLYERRKRFRFDNFEKIISFNINN